MVTFHGQGPRSVFVRILHAKPETACAKMREFGSFCVHQVALSSEAVKSKAKRTAMG